MGRKYQHKFTILRERNRGLRQFLYDTVLGQLSSEKDHQKAANDIKQDVLDFIGQLERNKYCQIDPRIVRFATKLRRCRPTATQAWFSPPAISGQKRKRVVLKHTCDNKLCPHCHYRRAHSAYLRFKREIKPTDRLWTAYAVLNIYPTKTPPDLARKEIERLARKLRRRVNDVYGLQKGLKIVRLTPPMECPMLDDLKWKVIIGCCMIVPKDVPLPEPDEVDLLPSTAHTKYVKTYTASEGPKVALVDLFRYSPLTIRVPYMWHLSWWFDAMSDFGEIGWMGFPPIESRFVDAKPATPVEAVAT
jgi:hypothetical protein